LDLKKGAVGWQKLLVLRWLLMVLPFALWGTAMAAMKPLLTGATPLTIAWMRLLPAGLLLLLVDKHYSRLNLPSHFHIERH
jgi:drug/metabolite transporter (DMT)-like permease